jgi:hypothetical protein
MRTLNKIFIRRQLYVQDDNEPRPWNNSKGVYRLQFKGLLAISTLHSLSGCNRVPHIIHLRLMESLMEILEVRGGVVVEPHRVVNPEQEAIATLSVTLRIAL